MAVEDQVEKVEPEYLEVACRWWSTLAEVRKALGECEASRAAAAEAARLRGRIASMNSARRAQV
jgi:predicted Zn-dependent protease